MYTCGLYLHDKENAIHIIIHTLTTTRTHTLVSRQYNPLTQSVVVSKSIARLDRSTTAELQVSEFWTNVGFSFFY